MAFQPAPNIVGVNIRATYHGEQVENTLYFETQTTPTAALVQEIAEQVEGWFSTSVLPIYPAELVYTETYARSLNSESAPEFTANTDAGENGETVSAGLPGNVTWVVKFLTGLTGRSYRGRNYLMALAEAQVTGNDILQVTADAYINAYNTLLTVQASFDWVWVVLSRVQDSVLLANAIGAPVNAVGYTDLHVDSQRRRLAGRGN